MSEPTHFVGASIFDGADWHEDAALLVEQGQVGKIVPKAQMGPGGAQIRLEGGMIVPGFIDLQVNGGGGALLNEVPTRAGIETICAAHVKFGTTALLPTLITDRPEITEQAIAAGIAAQQAGVKGFLGLHLEGPHLSVARKGAHDPELIRPMNEADMALYARARQELPNLLLTFAAETVRPEQITAMVDVGAVVSIGHSDASYQTVAAAAAAGASMATHLFNAMSQMGNREAGLVGAALNIGTMSAGLIADGIHVDAASMAVALRAKQGPGHIFLVTDAMSLTGTSANHFTLNGREIIRADGALRLADGTLAGADLTMIDAINYIHDTIGLEFDEALRMASLYPAQAMNIATNYGHLRPGSVANFVHLSAARQVQSTWIGGEAVYRA